MYPVLLACPSVDREGKQGSDEQVRCTATNRATQ